MQSFCLFRKTYAASPAAEMETKAAIISYLSIPMEFCKTLAWLRHRYLALAGRLLVLEAPAEGDGDDDDDDGDDDGTGALSAAQRRRFADAGSD